MPQLDDLLTDLAKAKDVEAAAKRDVCDRAQDHRETEAKLRRAEQRLEDATKRADRARLELHRIVEAQTHSAFDDELVEVGDA